MKKSYLILAFIIINASFAFSQNLQIYRNGNLLNNNTVLNITGGTSELIKLPLHIKNTAIAIMNVKAKKIETSLVQGSENSFCFAGTCYSPTTLVSLNFVAISLNATDTSFEADYNAYGRSGTSSITYVFFNTANPSDSVSVIVNYTTSVGINDIGKSEVYLSEIYPNPASDIISFSYSLPKQTSKAKITICNILGSGIANIDLNEMNGKKTVNTSDFKEGIYFYSLIVNDKVFYTKKLLIKR